MELILAKTILTCIMRRRGLGRAGGSGGVAKGEGTSARKGGWWDAQARRVEATRQEVARGRPSNAAVALHSGGGRRNKEASWRWKKKDLFAISKNSRDHSVNN